VKAGFGTLLPLDDLLHLKTDHTGFHTAAARVIKREGWAAVQHCVHVSAWRARGTVGDARNSSR
jgi:hypothetical protein